MMGRMACFVGAVTENGLRGCTGVANAGDEEGMAEDGGPGVLAPLKMCARLVFFFFGDIVGGSAMMGGRSERKYGRSGCCISSLDRALPGALKLHCCGFVAEVVWWWWSWCWWWFN